MSGLEFESISRQHVGFTEVLSCCELKIPAFTDLFNDMDNV